MLSPAPSLWQKLLYLHHMPVYFYGRKIRGKQPLQVHTWIDTTLFSSVARYLSGNLPKKPQWVLIQHLGEGVIQLGLLFEEQAGPFKKILHGHSKKFMGIAGTVFSEKAALALLYALGLPFGQSVKVLEVFAVDKIKLLVVDAVFEAQGMGHLVQGQIAAIRSILVARHKILPRQHYEPAGVYLPLVVLLGDARVIVIRVHQDL